MMTDSLRNQNGFTLIEIIVVIIVLGVIGGLAGMGVTSLAQGFMTARDTAETTEKAQMAIGRLVKEFSAIRTISETPSPTANSITYTRSDSPGTNRTVTLVNSGGNPPRIEVRLQGQTLVDDVNNFQLLYYNDYSSGASTYSAANTSIIEIILTMRGGWIFTNRVVLRRQFS